MKILFDLARLQFLQIFVFGGIFIGVYYFTLYDDGAYLDKLIKDVQSNIEQTEVKIKKKEEDLETVKEFEREILSEEEVVKYFLNFIPESLTYTELTSLLIKSAEFTGINIELKQDQKVQVREESEYQTLKIKLTINGSFSQIMFFLSRLTVQKRMLILQKINITIDRTSRLIKADLNIIAYRYNKRQQKEEEKKKENA